MKFRMFNNKLVFKITLGYILITLISLLIVGLFFINSFRQYTFENKETNMINRAREIAKISAQYVPQNDKLTEYKGFMELLDSFSNSRVWIVDNESNILVRSKGEFGGIEESSSIKNMSDEESTIEKVLSGQEIEYEGDSMFYNEPMITVGVPIYDIDNKVVGGVFLHSPVTGITDTIDRAFLFLIVSILFSILLSILLGWAYSSIIAKPLKLMNGAAIEITRGNYDIRTNIRQNDEIGQLSNSLDMLSAKLGFSIDQLFQEKGKLNDIIVSISEGIVVFDKNMILSNYNQALLKLFGYSSEIDVSDAIKRDLDQQGILISFTEVLFSGMVKSFVCGWSNLKLKFTLSPVKNNGNEITGVVALIQDISESERLEQMRKDLVANVSHELRTPLTLIKGSVEALIDEVVTEVSEVKKYHNCILNEASRLERLVNDILDFSRLQTGNLYLNFDYIDFCALVLETANSLKPICKIKEIDIVVKIIENCPPVKGDYDRIKQLLIIFLDNAVKYSNPNTKIQLSMEVNDYVYLKIKDTGIGISKEDLPFVWERFYKVDKARSNPLQGTGLGLSIAKLLVEAHNGTVRLESELNVGTTIILGLPYIRN